LWVILQQSRIDILSPSRRWRADHEVRAFANRQGNFSHVNRFSVHDRKGSLRPCVSPTSSRQKSVKIRENPLWKSDRDEMGVRYLRSIMLPYIAHWRESISRTKRYHFVRAPAGFVRCEGRSTLHSSAQSLVWVKFLPLSRHSLLSKSNNLAKFQMLIICVAMRARTNWIPDQSDLAMT
jgi:hypothetical protein